MQYPAISFPCEFESFKTLNKNQAQQLFDWYISEIPQRVKLLEECFNDEWCHSIPFDYSIDSLDLLWKAFTKYIKSYKKSRKDIMAENANLPRYVLDDMLNDNRHLANETEILAFDIAMYFGETLSRNFPGISWGFFTKPKNMASVNKAVLVGFMRNMYMDPTRIIMVGCSRFLDKPDYSYLEKIANVWKRYLPELPT